MRRSALRIEKRYDVVRTIHLDDAMLLPDSVRLDDVDATAEIGLLVAAAERVIAGEGMHISDVRGDSVSNMWRFHDDTMLVRTRTGQPNDPKKRVEIALTNAEDDIIVRLAVHDHRDPETVEDESLLAQDTLTMAQHGLEAARKMAQGKLEALHETIEAASRTAIEDMMNRLDPASVTPGMDGVHRIGTPWRESYAAVYPRRSREKGIEGPFGGFPLVVAVALSRWTDPVDCVTLRIGGVDFVHDDVAPVDAMTHMRALVALAELTRDPE